MRKAVLTLLIGMMIAPAWAQSQGLPKCRNLAGYEPKAVCEARNQRAMWQAGETARLTGDLVERALKDQAAEDRANEKSFTDQIGGFLKSAEKTIKGFF